MISESFLNGLALSFMPHSKSDSFVTFISNKQFTLKTANLSKNWNGILYYRNYSISNTWNLWRGEEITSHKENDKYFIALMGTDNTRLVNKNSYQENIDSRWIFSGDSYIMAIGNIESLLDYRKVDQKLHPEMGQACFKYLFADCTSLIIPPQILVETIQYEACANMFQRCVALMFPPKITASYISDYGCQSMFRECRSLKHPPALLAENIGAYSYNSMFEDCTALTTSTKLPATILPNNCYNQMFSNCTNLETLPKLPATQFSADSCYKMFSGCSKIKISTTQNETYNTTYRIPESGTASIQADIYGNTQPFQDMFENTGGTFTGTPTINTTYYTSNGVI